MAVVSLVAIVDATAVVVAISKTTVVVEPPLWAQVIVVAEEESFEGQVIVADVVNVVAS